VGVQCGRACIWLTLRHSSSIRQTAAAAAAAAAGCDDGDAVGQLAVPQQRTGMRRLVIELNEWTMPSTQDNVCCCCECGTPQDAERGRSSPLDNYFNHVIDPHFATFSSSLYTTIRNPHTNPNPSY